MAISNHERVGKALELLRIGLGPFCEREILNVFKDRTPEEINLRISDDRVDLTRPMAEWDIAVILKIMWSAWNEVFRLPLGHTERSLVSELREHRNKWAHQEAFSSDNTYRALDSAGRLLAAVSAPQAEDIEK